MGRREALAAADEALAACRELVAGDRAAYLEQLATSLATFADVRRTLSAAAAAAAAAALGRAEPLGAAREAVALFAELAETRPSAFSDKLAAVRELVRELGG